MSRKIVFYAKFVSFAALLFFIADGCGNSFQNQNVAQSKNEFQKTKSLVTPQYELVETPKYKELKKQVEKMRNETAGLKIKMDRLKAVYTEKYPPVKKASNNFAETKKKLAQLEELLNTETEKLQKRPINSPV